MKIYNTLTRQKEEFVTMYPGEVRMYVCGPTVYNLIHIGNARPICVFDTHRRYFEYRGYRVNFVQNFTDVDDKIIKRAHEEGTTANEISTRYIAEYRKDAEGLGAKPATVHPKVTENMDSIIAFVQKLVEKGYAYESQGDVYFRTQKFAEYGKLSHMPMEELEAGARVDVSEQKEDPMDFVLWKAAKPGEPYWDSPWGKGRPGWHIECSAMAQKYLGSTIDLHCGGQDLIFPHHENEIAQSECANGVPFAHYWMHNGFINIDNRKMSKSLNNFFTTRDVAEKYGYEPIRFMMLQAHYRSPLNYSVEVIEQCCSALERLRNFQKNITFALQSAPDGECSTEQQTLLDARRQQFIDAMEDDFNTADAISAVFELVRDANPAVSGKNPGTKGYLAAVQQLFDELTGVLGLLQKKEDEEIPAEILELIEKRKEARKNKDFATADAIRDEINSKGYLVEETRQGTKISKK